MKRRGFTLIELLVVIAILGLLISMLIPSLSRARQAAKTAVCSSNMRGLMQAVHQFASDNKDKLVSAGLAHGGSGNEHAAWINTLEEYYGGNEKIARCPMDQSEHWDFPIAPAAPGENGEQGHLEPILRKTSYGSNYYTVARIGQDGPYNQLSMIKRPATTIFMVELVEVGSFATSDHVHPETWWSNPRKLASEEMELDRHRGKANYSFFDAHVETLDFEETYAIDAKRSSFRKVYWITNFYDPAIGR